MQLISANRGSTVRGVGNLSYNTSRTISGEAGSAIEIYRGMDHNGEMYGQITMLLDDQGAEKLCRKYIPGYDPQWFSLVAIRLFSGKEILLTIYAEDRSAGKSNLHEGKFPVKKIKTMLNSAAELLELVSSFNFTVANPLYNIDEMEVVNK